MNSAIHVIVENDNVFKNKLKSKMESFDFIFKFYNDEEVFISTYTYPKEENATDCVLLFVGNNSSHINKLKNLTQSLAVVPVIVIAEEPSAALCRDCFKAGAFDFYVFPFDDRVFLSAIQGANEHFDKQNENHKKYIYLADKFDRLSAREREIMDMILDGNTSRETAEKLSLSPRTVEVHRSNIYTKLGIKSLPQLIQEYEYINTYSANA
ncbi:LuxR C-terminal-related transcriptional regulator [Providencia alcalifaciens]|uniref:response regulator transcription factor n=1 Tax=Providencia TaxID=586 RepID=UPI0023490B0C|nr:LuxR C-terminal-related transcriptional regulator [Providencia sp. PROV033]